MQALVRIVRLSRTVNFLSTNIFGSQIKRQFVHFRISKPLFCNFQIQTKQYAFFSSSSNENEFKPRSIDEIPTEEILDQINILYEQGIKNLPTKEVEHLRKCTQIAAERNHAPSQLLLGTFYSQGIGTEQNDKMSLHWFRKAAELKADGESESIVPVAQFAVGLSLILGETKTVFRRIQGIQDEGSQYYLDMDNLDFRLGKGFVVPKNSENQKWLKQEKLRLQKEKNPENSKEFQINVSEGLQYLQLSAVAGYCEAQLTLAHLLLNGENGIQKNVDEGIQWLEKASENANMGGKITALYELGKLYFEGTEVKLDLLKSLLYFKQAADLNDPNSQYWLGYVFHNGIGDQPNIELALEYLTKAANQKHGGALYYLSQMYRNGEGVLKNRELMMKYLNEAAKVSNADALFCLGDMYYYGLEGLEVDYPKALEFFTLAGKNGNADACVNEGVMYFSGLGTEVNHEKAFYAYQNAVAIDQNHIAALRSLADMYSNGYGVSKSPENASYFTERANRIENKQNK